MGRYSAEQSAFIVAHYKVDMRGKEVAAHLGVNAISIKNHARVLRRKKIKVAEAVAPVGTIRTYYRNGKVSHQCQKQADGKWAYIKKGSLAELEK